MLISFFVDKSDMKPANIVNLADVSTCSAKVVNAHSSPGFGGVRWPCLIAGDVENLLRALEYILYLHMSADASCRPRLAC